MSSTTSLRAVSILRPMSPALFASAALAALITGAVYCLGYEALRGGLAQWPPSLLWSACAVLPWLLLFEGVKRHEWAADRPLPVATTVLLLAATALFSLLLETGSDLLLGHHAAPLGLQLLRRLPAIGATVLLLLLARQAKSGATGRAQTRTLATEAESLCRYAASIRWIGAADNYLELHLPGQVWMRRMTMREAEQLLAPLGFVRIHRCAIVNRAHVAAVVPGARGVAVRLDDGVELPGGAAFADNLRLLQTFATSPQKD